MNQGPLTHRHKAVAAGTDAGAQGRIAQIDLSCGLAVPFETVGTPTPVAIQHEPSERGGDMRVGLLLFQL